MPASCWQYAGMTQAEDQHELDLGAVFAALERPLALVDSPERRAEIRRFIEAARIHLERAIFDLLSKIVESINEASGANAHLRYEGGVLRLVVESREPPEPEAEPIFTADVDMEKVTIRLPKDLKDLIDQAANLRGSSANAWYIQELGRSIARFIREEARREDVQRRPGRHPWRPGGSLRGFVGED